jgi:3-hydroxypropanoate dehydrogenase
LAGDIQKKIDSGGFMRNAIGDAALDVLFREARSFNAWLNEPVSDEILRQVYNLMRWAPTSANGNPTRIVFLRALVQMTI